MFFMSTFWDNVGGAIVDALRSLMLSLCDIIYKLIAFFFDIFMILGDAKILGEVTIGEFYTRVGLILGLFMIFRVTFSLIQYVINPDLMLDKKGGLVNIVKRIFIVIVLLGITRPLFNMAYDVQGLIINSNIIPKVITGKNFKTNDAGVNLAWYTFNSFYKFDDNYVSIENNDDVAKSCHELNSELIENDFKDNRTLRYAYNCVNERRDVSADGLNTKEKFSGYIIDFDGHGILAVVVGLFILYMILIYVIQVGVRVIQLAYLQLVAPIPIIGYLAPKGEDTLNKWFKQCVTTFLDFFIRVAILYFVVFIISFLTDTASDNYKTFISSLGNVDGFDLDFIIIIMIIALLVFAQKVPKLLKEVFPSLGGGAAGFSFGLNPKKEVLEPLKWAYKSTPLGWAPKALGWTAKKTITAIDRKKYDLPKPRNKVQQYFDKLTPGHAEYVKNKNNAILDEKQRQNRLSSGSSIARSYSNDDGKLDSDAAFKNQQFRESYDKVAKAKKNLGTAELQLEQAQSNLHAAYNLSPADPDRAKKIAAATEIYETAKKNHKAMSGQLDLAKSKHDTNRKIYTKDAKVEDDYKYWKDISEIEDGYREIKELNVKLDTNYSVEKSSSAYIEAYKKLMEMQNSNASNEEINAQKQIFSSLSEKLELAKQIETKKEEIRQEEEKIRVSNEKLANCSPEEREALLSEYMANEEKKKEIYSELEELKKKFDDVGKKAKEANGSDVPVNNSSSSDYLKRLSKMTVNQLYKERDNLQNKDKISPEDDAKIKAIDNEITNRFR